MEFLLDVEININCVNSDFLLMIRHCIKTYVLSVILDEQTMHDGWLMSFNKKESAYEMLLIFL